MFFDQFKKNNKGNGQATARPAALVAAPGTGHEPVSAPPHPQLQPDQLRRTVEPGTFDFASTAELEPAVGLIGQERALRAIDFGVSMDSEDFNIFVLGPPASGKRTAVRAYLERHAEQSAASVYDWVYVNNFEDNNNPKALRLPCGRATPFEKSMVAMIDELRQTLPAIFEGDEYKGRRRQIDEGFRAG